MLDGAAGDDEMRDAAVAFPPRPVSPSSAKALRERPPPAPSADAVMDLFLDGVRRQVEQRQLQADVPESKQPLR